MAVLCLLTNTPWPWPTPAGAASARGGGPTRNEVEGGRRPVCTSAGRKMGGPLVARRGRSPSAGLFPLHQRKTQTLRLLPTQKPRSPTEFLSEIGQLSTGL